MLADNMTTLIWWMEFNIATPPGHWNGHSDGRAKRPNISCLAQGEVPRTVRPPRSVDTCTVVAGPLESKACMKNPIFQAGMSSKAPLVVNECEIV